jgi:integration host factor subunit beta
MIKSELVECVTRAYPGLDHGDAETAVDAVSMQLPMRSPTATGSRSGASEHSRPGSDAPVLGVIPRTGQPVPVVAKLALMFKTSKRIREALKPHGVKVSRARLGVLGYRHPL